MPMKKRLLPIVMLIAYSAILINVMVFKNMPAIRAGGMMLNFGGTHEGEANLVPFKTILPYLLGEGGFIIAFINIAGNIALLIPVGFLLPFVYRGITWKRLLVIAIATGLTIESMQALLHVGIFDIDDVILNGLGVMLGFWAYVIGAKMSPRARVATIFITTIITVAAAVVFYRVTFNHTRRALSDMRGAGPSGIDTAKPYNDSIQPGYADNAKDKTYQLPDPCSGTGGTGEIISVGDHAITIKRNDGVEELIKLGTGTKIKDAAGVLAATDLKVGYRVTVVVGLVAGDERLASAVMVCEGGR